MNRTLAWVLVVLAGPACGGSDSGSADGGGGSGGGGGTADTGSAGADGAVETVTDASGDANDAPPVASAKFTEVGLAAGLNWSHHGVDLKAKSVYDHGNGMAADDIDGDGHDDLILLSQCGATGYFAGKGDGTFEDRSARVTVLDDAPRMGVAIGDYDNDGDADLFVTRAAFTPVLLRQEPGGTFVDVSAAAGLSFTTHVSGAAFLDIDRDGDLDLVVAGNMQFTKLPKVAAGSGCPAHFTARTVNDVLGGADSDPTLLFVNGGAAKSWAFTEEAGARGIPLGGKDAARLGFSDVVPADYDGDGDQDLLLVEMYGGNSALMENSGDGHFTDATAARAFRPSFGAASAAIADIDGDGRLDIFMTDMHSDMWFAQSTPFSDIMPHERYKSYRGPTDGLGDNPTGPFFGNTLALQRTKGAFEDHDLDWHAETFNPWGPLVADFDNDGDLDVYVPSGMGNPFDYFPNIFLDNRGDRFVEQQMEVGIEPPPGGAFDPMRKIDGMPFVKSMRSAAALDIDDDGDLDLAVLSWNDRVLLFRNDLPAGNHWLDVSLVGIGPRDGTGATIEVKAGSKTVSRSLEGERGYLGSARRRAHFGLGASVSVDAVTVHWADGKTTTTVSPGIDKKITITEM